jgi:nicotinamide-nucleotide amidase
MDVLQRQFFGPRVELLCVGTELLMGKLNTHGAYFSALLEDLGLPLARETTVSDDPREMELLFRETWKRADVVVVTGGLGPTFDDLTRDVWAKVCRRPLVFRPEIAAVIAERFRRRGTPLPPANLRQAYLIQGARELENANGTAPGQLLEAGRKTLILLPGPGREMKPMAERHVVPFLKEHFSGSSRRTKMWRIFGMPESIVDQQLRGMFTSREGVSWGILAQDGVVDVKMTVSGPDDMRVEKILSSWDARMRKKFGVVIFGNGGDTLESVVGDLLRRAGKTVSVAESCTGGGLAQKFTSVPGSSAYFWGGAVTYANDAKVNLVSVKKKTVRRFGAVSAETAAEMAENMRRQSGTDYAISITGIAGPSGGSPQKPVGLTYIGLADPDKTRVYEKKLLGDRALIRSQASLWALDSLRRDLLVS